MISCHISIKSFQKWQRSEKHNKAFAVERRKQRPLKSNVRRMKGEEHMAKSKQDIIAAIRQ
jgi:hypothetical protein